MCKNSNEFNLYLLLFSTKFVYFRVASLIGGARDVKWFKGERVSDGIAEETK